VLPLERVQQNLAAELIVAAVRDRERDGAPGAQLRPLRPQPLAHVLLGRVVLEAQQPAELGVGSERLHERVDVRGAQRPQHAAVAR
jgi:hypothetical protein